MQLVGLIRTNRAISACLLFPENPIKAIAISETISVISPLLDPYLLSRILGALFAIIYQPHFAYYYIKKYHEICTINNQAEICCLLLFVTTLGIQYLH